MSDVAVEVLLGTGVWCPLVGADRFSSFFIEEPTGLEGNILLFAGELGRKSFTGRHVDVVQNDLYFAHQNQREKSWRGGGMDAGLHLIWLYMTT